MLRSATITNFTAASQNKNYRFKVRVFNREGFTDSPFLRLVNTGRPNNVKNQVTVLRRNCTSLHVKMPEVDDDDYIVSYELQIDDGKGGDFVSVGGFDYNTKESEYEIGNLTSGVSYRLRYRVCNSVGWSTFSPEYNALVADVPTAPSSIEFV